MASKDKTVEVKGVTISADKVFDATVKRISKKAEDVSQDLHSAGLYCINQANQFNSADKAQRLIEAIGNKQDIRRVARWMQTFGKIGVKNNLLVFKKRKDITPANADGWLKKADATPYWELTPQPKLEVTFDYLAMLNSILNRAANKPKLEEEGKTVHEKNVAVLEEIKGIILAHTPKEDQDEIKEKAANIANRTKSFTEPAAMRQ